METFPGSSLNLANTVNCHC